MINLEQAQQKVMSKEKAKKLCSNAVKMQRLKHNKKVNKKIFRQKSGTEFMSCENNKNKINISVVEKLKEISVSVDKPTKEKNVINENNKTKEIKQIPCETSKHCQKDSNLAKKRGSLTKDEGPQRKKKKTSLTIKEIFERKLQKDKTCE